MNRLLSLFESLIILRTDMNNIDLNCIEYDKIEYNTQLEELIEIYYDWYEDINTMYLDIKNELLKCLS